MSTGKPMSVNEVTTGSEENVARSEPVGRFLTPNDLFLALAALRMARAAQLVKYRPIKDVMRVLVSTSGLPKCKKPRSAARAAARGGLRFDRWFGGLDTCLTRSLVAGAMLCRSHDVELHLGCRVSEGRAPIDGHAWLVVDGERIETSGAQSSEKPYTTVFQLPYRYETGEVG
jgi:hypothetical protein